MKRIGRHRDISWREDVYAYQIATPEKALCDKLYTMPPVRNKKRFTKTTI